LCKSPVEFLLGESPESAVARGDFPDESLGGVT
jgi:hypothetical protein